VVLGTLLGIGPVVMVPRRTTGSDYTMEVNLDTDVSPLTLPNRPNLALIGIGAAVTRRPLPHHRAYGSVHGGSSRLRQPFLEQGRKSKRFEVHIGKPHGESFG